MQSILPPSPDAQVDPTPRAYLHEPCGILATIQWWREHRGVCGGCETTEGWSPLFSDTALDDPDALDSLPIAVVLHSRLASWFGDDRQAFLVSDLVPVVTQGVAELQHNAVDMARKAAIAERRAEEAEFHVEQLGDARDSAERRIERAERLIDSWEHDAPDHSNPVFIGRLRETLLRDPAPVRLRGEGCEHDWLDRPESDTRECLICGTEVAGRCG